MTYEEKLDFILGNLPYVIASGVMTNDDILGRQSFQGITEEEKSQLFATLFHKEFIIYITMVRPGLSGQFPFINDKGRHFLETTGGFAVIKKKEEALHKATIQTDYKTTIILWLTAVAVLLAAITLIRELSRH